MSSRRNFLFQSAASTVDQALLSLLNFLVGLALIRIATKDVYGLYTMLFAAGQLTMTLIHAVIGSALVTTAAQMSEISQRTFLARVARLNWIGAFVLAAIAGVVVSKSIDSISVDAEFLNISLSFAGYVFAQAVREYTRTVFFIQSKPFEVLKIDAAFFILTLSFGLTWYILHGYLNLTSAFTILFFANIASSSIASYSLWVKGLGTSVGQLFIDASDLWKLSRWAFIGAIVGWSGNNAYIYFAGVYLGLEASAELNSARILLVPAAMLCVAWGQVAQPIAGKFLMTQDHRAISGFYTKSMFVLSAAIGVFTVLLWISFPWVRPLVLGSNYPGIDHLVLIWGIYFMVNAARAVSTTILMSYGCFKALFWQGSMSLMLLCCGCLLLMPKFGIEGALIAMILVEITELLTNLGWLLPRARLGFRPIESRREERL